MSDGGEDPGQRVLLDIAQQLASTRDLSALVPLVLERVVALLNAERAMFVLLDLDGQIDRAVTHNLPWPGPPAPLPIARSILDRVVREGKMLVASTLDDSAMGSTDSMRRFGLRRVVAVPVLRGIVVFGVIYVDSTGRADGVHEQAETLRALASLVGVSVENARLFDELRYRRDLLAWMVHDLRNPITAVSLNAALLLERAEGEDRAGLTGEHAVAREPPAADGEEDRQDHRQFFRDGAHREGDAGEGGGQPVAVSRGVHQGEDGRQGQGEYGEPANQPAHRIL